MPADAQTIAESAAWLESFTLASTQLKESTARVAEAAWLSFDGWYDAKLVAQMAAEMAAFSTAAQQATAGLSAQYMTGAVAAATGSAVLSSPPSPWQTIRNGVDLLLVNHRPAEAYKRAIARGATHEEALVKAGLRAANMVLSDLTLEDRISQQVMLESLGISTYRRVIRPELSKSGTCGLCIVAADRIYTTGDLMPIHPPSCKCVVMPIIGDNDPGGQLNRDDLDQLYADAGSNKAEDLRRTRYQVNEHGEYGPVISRAGDNFRGPDQVALEDDPARARRMLDKISPVLTRLEARAADGEDLAGPLKYQRDLIDRLSRIVGN